MIKNNKLIFSLIFNIIGISMIFLGIGWMFVEEPWLLDKVANEERLGMPFDELFSNEINKTLPGYLKQIYSFFGLWVIIIGLFITLLSRQKISQNKDIRLILLICTACMILPGLILGYILIPSSPFIYFGWLLIILYLISLYNQFHY